MLSKFIIRFDDIAPGMAWSKFSAFDALSTELDIPFLVGVVPHCLDPTLAVEPVRHDFWDVVREWSARGWTIAQHGYTHQYVTRDPGILGIGHQSELAGLSYKQQFAKLDAGKSILVQQGVWQPVFMAPSHSLDEVTLRVLKELKFCSLTDGYGVYPYKMGSLTAVPQLIGVPMHFGFGVYTICLHVNEMSQAQILNTLRFVRAHRRQIISFEEALAISCPIPGVAWAMQFITSAALRKIRDFRFKKTGWIDVA
jgi:predicted deacetylase